MRTFIACLIAAAILADAAHIAAQADEQYRLVIADGCTIMVPVSFKEQAPKAPNVLDVSSPARSDDQKQSNMTVVQVQRVRNGNPSRKPIEEMIDSVLQNQKSKSGAALLEGPIVATMQIPGATGARSLSFRQSERNGMEFRHVDIYVCSGADLWIANGYVAAMAGSKVTHSDQPAAMELQRILQSLQLTAATTQPAK